MSAHIASPGKKRVAILGAGPAGLATAFALAETRRFDVHVYQVGWRAGGKCATGREQPYVRSLQNGSHYLFGCYYNAFALIRKAYLVLDESNDPEKERFGSFAEEFVSRNLLVGAQKYLRANSDEPEVEDWYQYMPQNMSKAGDGGKFPSFFDYCLTIFQFALGFAIDFVCLFVRRRGPMRFVGMRFCLHVFRLDPLDRALRARVVRAILWLPRWLVDTLIWRPIRMIYSVVSFLAVLGVPARGRRQLQGFIDWLGRGLLWLVRRASKSFYRMSLSLPQGGANSIQRTFLLVDLAVTLLVGYVRDGLNRPGGLASIDHIDFRRWLLDHGAHENTVESALVRTWYDATIAYENGEQGQARCSAAVAVLSMLRALLSYKGAFAYQMRAEVGDSLIAPLVKALELQNVRFHFYSRVKKLIVSGADRRVQRVTLGVQCEGHGPAAEFMEVPDQEFPRRPPRKAWPSAPRCEACGHAQPPIDSYYSDHEVGERTIFAREGGPADSDEAFDLVVAALPLGVIEDVLVNDDLSSVANSDANWADCFKHIRHTESQAVRMWFNVPLHPKRGHKSLGWAHDPPILSGFKWPHTTWEDNSQATAINNFPKDQQPLTIATVFGALATGDIPIRDPRHLQQQVAIARIEAQNFIENTMLTLWKGLATTDAAGQNVRIDWDSFIDLENRQHEERFKWQHVVANVGPNESYVQAFPGTLKYRLRVDESGYRNLFLAGDWTHNGLEVGCVEAAVISGLKAAHAISGEGDPIIGGDDLERGTVLS